MPKVMPKTTANITTCCQLSIDDSYYATLDAIPPNNVYMVPYKNPNNAGLAA
jgi:hypothetical protein